MEEIKKKKEGFTNKKTKTIGEKRNNVGKDTQTAVNSALWTTFATQTFWILLFFWGFFPFWSYQLQVILDQEDCEKYNDKDKIPGRAISGCSLPWLEKEGLTPLPYAPELNAKAHLPQSDILKKMGEWEAKFWNWVIWFFTLGKRGLDEVAADAEEAAKWTKKKEEWAKKDLEDDAADIGMAAKDAAAAVAEDVGKVEKLGTSAWNWTTQELKDVAKLAPEDFERAEKEWNELGKESKKFVRSSWKELKKGDAAINELMKNMEDGIPGMEKEAKEEGTVAFHWLKDEGEKVGKMSLDEMNAAGKWMKKHSALMASMAVPLSAVPVLGEANDAFLAGAAERDETPPAAYKQVGGLLVKAHNAIMSALGKSGGMGGGAKMWGGSGSATGNVFGSYNKTAADVIVKELPFYSIPKKAHALPAEQKSEWDVLQTQAKCCTALKQKQTGIDMAASVGARIALDAEEKECHGNKSAFVKFFSVKEFGWPYNYIYDSPKAKEYMDTEGKKGTIPKAYNPEKEPIDGHAIPKNTEWGGKVAGNVTSWKSWVMAWFAQTQVKAWSRNRWLVHKFLGLFYSLVAPPPLDCHGVNEMFVKVINKITELPQRIKNEAGFKKTIENQIGNKEKDMNSFKNKLKDYKGRFQNIQIQFNKKCKKACRDSADDRAAVPCIKNILWESLKQSILIENIAIGLKKTKLGKEDVARNQEFLSVFLDFFIAAIKPPPLRPYKGWCVFWDWCNPVSKGVGGLDGWFPLYWRRYLMTFFMPTLISVTMAPSWFLSTLQTFFACFNRYLIRYWWWGLLFFFFLFGFPIFINSIAQPLELFYYLIFGPLHTNNNSSACPYTGGVYQLKSNYHNYGPLNAFICLAYIITHLGITLLATTQGQSTTIRVISGFIAAFFPAIIGLRLLWGLWNCLKMLFRKIRPKTDK